MLRFIAPSILWTILVIILSLSPSSQLGGNEISFEGFDKIAHFVMYSLLTLFWITGLKRQNKSKNLRAKAFLIVTVSAFVLSLILELLQEFFVISRYFEGLDLIANGFGCIFGVLLFKLVYRTTADKKE
ncbi:MAG: VanZ family protein [Brumimicrobium sp.]